jgi:PAS domain S-box-containing protein
MSFRLPARLTSMTTGLAVGITAAVTVASAAGAYLYSLRHVDSLLDTARSSALERAELIRGALEHGMLEDDRTLIEQMISTFGREPRVVNVMLLDRDGVVQFSSGPVGPGDSLNLQSPTCQACHRYPPAERASSRVLETQGGSILRTVVPFRNREACHECHEPEHAINGVLISDLDAAGIRAAASRDLRWMVGVTGAITLLLVAAIGIIVRLVLLRRLQRFETAARQISQGDLTRRVPDAGTDTISWLGREFNAMADSVSALVGQVRGERERLETVINSIDDGIVVLDPNRRVVAANDAFLRRTGRARHDLLGCSCRTDGSGACNVSDCPTVACLHSGERQIRICERRAVDGSTVWEEVHASPVDSPDGGPRHVVEVWRDISERRTAEARLAESHRLASLGLLASGFSHEMNTPLGTVLACVEGIAREVRTSADGLDAGYISEHATVAREQVLRCRGITQQFLRMSRGQPAVALVVDIRTVIASAVRLVEPTAREHGATIHVEAPPDGPMQVRSDDAELQHVLINLLLNAILACTSPGEVTVRAVAGNPVTVTISDNGCGIAAEHQRRIFEPFFTLRPNGTGLGLFLSLTFVRRCGGDITVTSTPGGGSTFTITLPTVGGAAAQMSA